MSDERTNELYKLNFDLVVSQAGILEHLDLDAMLETVNRADSIGPLLDPTAWIKGHKNLPPQRRILEAAIAFRNAVRRERQEAMKAVAGVPEHHVFEDGSEATHYRSPGT